MRKLTECEETLVGLASEAIVRNYDGENGRHTVGAAVLCGSGRTYAGVNVYSLHGVCAELVALGAAVTAGERDFVCIVAVRGQEGREIVSPCGNCRQILADYAPLCRVVVRDGEKVGTVPAEKLLPFSYRVPS